jgi:hypothetical protein
MSTVWPWSATSNVASERIAAKRSRNDNGPLVNANGPFR